jgi:hypothetical protein
MNSFQKEKIDVVFKNIRGGKLKERKREVNYKLNWTLHEKAKFDCTQEEEEGYFI